MESVGCKVCRKGVLRTIFGPEEEIIIGGWKELRNWDKITDAYLGVGLEYNFIDFRKTTSAKSLT